MVRYGQPDIPSAVLQTDLSAGNGKGRAEALQLFRNMRFKSDGVPPGASGLSPVIASIKSGTGALAQGCQRLVFHFSSLDQASKQVVAQSPQSLSSIG